MKANVRFDQLLKANGNSQFLSQKSSFLFNFFYIYIIKKL